MMTKLKIPFFLALLLISHWCSGQRSASGDSEEGHLIHKLKNPLLELRLIESEENTNVLFPGSTLTLHLEITNTGTATAKKCILNVDYDNDQLEIEFDKGSFDLEPGKAATVKMKLRAGVGLPAKPISIALGIDELNGYNLFPNRRMNFFVTDQPEQNLTVIDLAVEDQMGFSFFDKFDEITVFFRVQNCSSVEQTNVIASTDFHEGTLDENFNTELHIGSLSPGETFDVFGSVSSGVAAENIGLHIKLNSDQSSFSQSFYFEFNQEYKTSNEMFTDGCGQIHPQISLEFDTYSEYKKLEAKQVNTNKIAIIVVNESYTSFDNPYYSSEIEAVAENLETHQGYHPDNIHVFENLNNETLSSLLTLSGREYRPIRRAIRASDPSSAFSFFFFGLGAADLHHNELYFLPVNYNKTTASNKYKISTIVHKLNELKDDNDLISVVSFFNIDYAVTSDYGFFDHQLSELYQIHEEKQGLVTFFSNAPTHSNLSTETNISLFTDFYLEGIKGRADINNRDQITTDNLLYLITDEFIGIPAYSRQQKGIPQVPFYFGNNFVLF